jgi:DNA-binding NtrC family response regulator
MPNMPGKSSLPARNEAERAEAADITAVGIHLSHDHRVLIVEDDDLVAYFLSQVLSSVFEIERVSTVTDGLARVQRDPCLDALLLDLVLPNGQGLSLIRRFQEVSPKTAIVVLTGYPFDEEEVIMAGAQEFLMKPPNIDRLIGYISSAIVRHRVRHQYAPLDKEFEEAKKEVCSGMEETGRVLQIEQQQARR